MTEIRVIRPEDRKKAVADQVAQAQHREREHQSAPPEAPGDDQAGEAGGGWGQPDDVGRLLLQPVPGGEQHGGREDVALGPQERPELVGVHGA